MQGEKIKMASYCPQGSGTLCQQLLMMHGIALDLGDGQFSERCNVDGSFFNSDAIPIIFGKA